MKKEEIELEVVNLIIDNLSITKEEIKMESNLVDDLGADSLDVVELIMAIEEKFDIDIPDDEAEKIVLVKDIVNYLNN